MCSAMRAQAEAGEIWEEDEEDEIELDLLAPRSLCQNLELAENGGVIIPH